MPTDEPRHHFLPALAFSAAFVGAVHMATFVWLTGFIYKGNIRGYVPAGITGMMYLAAGGLIATLYLGLVGYRRSSGSYLLGGCLGVPVAFLATSLGTSLVVGILGYTLQTDVAVGSVCGGLCLLIALAVYWRWLRRSTD